jgi:hypothetical protein
MDPFSEALIYDKRGQKIPEEYDFFGKLVGEWDFVNIFDNGKMEAHGEWIFSWILQGSAIQDTFISPSRKERMKNPLRDGDYSEYGTTVRIFIHTTKVWDVVYCDTGCIVRLEAKKESDKIILTEITKKKMRFVFTEITENTFHWQHMITDDKGEWIVDGELYATRRG